ncbi:MAG: hypothetical protein NTW87_37200 [Planctomycetota bacterium]|nr:hypothetical protein [Planctomycetota bacterium]
MNRLALTLLACVAVVANIAVPQRLLIYKACCYDANGRLMADAAMPCKQKSGTDTISGPDCCAPDEYTLRPAPPSDSLTPTPAQDQTPGSDKHLAAAIAGPVAPAGSDGLLPYRISGSTGPPGCTDVLLLLHSRLNL